VITTDELLDLESAVGRAIRTRDASELNLLGHGEVCLALGWPADAPRLACKRLPPFTSEAACVAYADVIDRYVAVLRERGVRVLDTEVRWIRRADGRYIVFHLQPAVDQRTLGTHILADTAASPDHPMLRAVVQATIAATANGVGVDAQFSNWVWIDDGPWQLDLTTPFWMLDNGKMAFDLAPFLNSLPMVIRPTVRREMEKLIKRWMTPRGALMDLVANLIKAGLLDWVEPALQVINEHLDSPVTEAEARRTYETDLKTWPLMLRMQKANRAWQERVRRRPYEQLLPDHTTYSA
jgi:hypothetical protein